MWSRGERGRVMKKIKKIICYTIALATLSAMTSCSLQEAKEQIYNKANKVGKKINNFVEDVKNIDDNSEEQKPSVDKTVIQALQNKDSEAIKNMFSVQAKELCPDIDEKIEYMISIFEGEYVKCEHHNSDGRYFSGEDERSLSHPICVFQTTEKRYELTWTEWSGCKKRKEKNGVYSMKLRVLSDEKSPRGGRPRYTAGIITLDISNEEDVAWALWYNIYQENRGKFRIYCQIIY